MSGLKFMMNIFYLWIFCYILNYGTANEQFQVSVNQSTWLEAANRCSLATPEINYGNFLVDLQVEMVPAKLWVGYYRKPTVFQYKGCMSTKDYNTTNNFLPRTSRARCRSICRESLYFGISKNFCYCINNEQIRNQRQSGCKGTCGSYVCTDGNDYMSIYKEIRAAPGELPLSPVECRSYDFVNKRFLWSNCEDTKRTVCNCDNKPSFTFGDRNWSSAIQSCQQQNCYLVSNPTSTINNSHRTKSVWTSIISGTVIDKDDFKGHFMPKVGFLAKDSIGKIHLRFGYYFKLRRALCSKSKDQNDKLADTDEGKNIDTQIDLIVGVSVPSVLLVITVVTVSIILIRRKRINTKYEDNVPSNEVEYHNTTVSSSSTNKSPVFVNIIYHGEESETSDQNLNTKESDYSKHRDGNKNGALSRCYSNHTHHIFKKQGDRPNDSTCKASPVAEAMKICENEYAYAIPEEGENSSYKAHLGNLHKKVAVRDGNTAAAADDDDGNDYHSYAVLDEHGGISGVIKNVDQSDKLVGSSESVNEGKTVDYMDHVGEYDSTVHTQKWKERNLNNARHRQLNEEHTNAYNVLEIRPRRASYTDPTYNKLGGDVNVMNHVDKGIYNVLDLEDDVYNHTTTVQDNPASTPKGTYDTFANVEKRFDKTLSQF